VHKAYNIPNLNREGREGREESAERIKLAAHQRFTAKDAKNTSKKILTDLEISVDL